MEPIDYGAVLRKWPVLVVFAVIGAVVGFALPGHTQPGSQATLYATTALVGAPPQDTNRTGAGILIEEGVSTTQIVYYAQNAQVAQNAAQAAGITGAVPVLEQLIQVTGPSDQSGIPGIVQITGKAPTPSQSATWTNAFAKALGDFMLARAQGAQQYKVQQLQAAITALQAQSPGSVGSELTADETALAQAQAAGAGTGYSILQPALADFASSTVVGKASLAANRKVRVPVGALIGVLIAVGLLVLREMLNKRLRSATRAEETFGYPVVGEIPAVATTSRADDGIGVGVWDDPVSPAAEAYRKLRMSVIFEELATHRMYESGAGLISANGDNGALWHGADVDGGFGNGRNGVGRSANARPERTPPARRQVVLVVSAGTEATRPFVVANLAAAYAEAGQQVLVMSTADLHAMPRANGNGNGPTHGNGSTPSRSNGSSPSGEIRPEDLEAYLEPSSLENVWRLSLGHFVSINQLVARAPAVIDAARQLVDLVLVDAPPLLAVADGEALSQIVDAVLVVGECMSTTVDEARQAGGLLRRIGAPVLGVVFTNVHLPPKDVRRFMPQPQVEEPPMEEEALLLEVGGSGMRDGPEE